MKKIHIISLFLLIPLIFIYLACQNVAVTKFDPAFVRGVVTDSLSGGFIDSVNLTVLTTSIHAFSDTNGIYFIDNIHMPSNTWIATVSATHPAYNTSVLDILLNNGDTATVNIKMLHF